MKRKRTRSGVFPVLSVHSESVNGKYSGTGKGEGVVLWCTLISYVRCRGRISVRGGTLPLRKERSAWELRLEFLQYSGKDTGAF